MPFTAPPVASYVANMAYSGRQQFAPQTPYPPYGMQLPVGYDASLMMGMNSIAASSDGWVSPVPSHLAPLLVGGPHMDQFRTNTLSPTFSPTSGSSFLNRS